MADTQKDRATEIALQFFIRSIVTALPRDQQMAFKTSLDTLSDAIVDSMPEVRREITRIRESLLLD